MALWRTLMISGILLAVESAAAQSTSFMYGSDGTNGMVMDLGNGFHTYSDSHGNSGTIMSLGGGMQTYQFRSPQGDMQSGTIVTFPPPGSSPGIPPAGMTPAPVLPFSPKGPLMPQPLAPMNSGAGSRFGR